MEGGGVLFEWRLELPCLARVGLCFFGFSDGWCLVVAIAVYGGVLTAGVLVVTPTSTTYIFGACRLPCLGPRGFLVD